MHLGLCTYLHSLPVDNLHFFLATDLSARLWSFNAGSLLEDYSYVLLPLQRRSREIEVFRGFTVLYSLSLR